MARKSEVVTIDDKQITVFEMRVKDLLELLKGDDGKLGNVTMSVVQDRLGVFLPKLTTSTLEELEELAPSELEELYLAFKRVNSTLLSVMEKSGLGKLLGGMKETLMMNLNGLLISSLKEATDQMSGNTDTPTS